MKFFCEYCGNRIDATKDNKCPNCGASYKKNKSFLKLEEEKKKQLETNQENAQKIFDHVFSVFKFSRWFMLIPVVIFIVVFIAIISTFGRVRNSADTQTNNNKNDQTQIKEEVDNFFEEIINQQNKEPEKVVVNFDEFAETEEYKVKVNKYEVIEDTFKKAEEGYELVKFYLLVENLTGKEIDTEDVNCVVDGIAQNNYYYSGHSDLPFDVKSGLTVKGTSTFIVPKDAKTYEIKYGDYVTIKIQK